MLLSILNTKSCTINMTKPLILCVAFIYKYKKETENANCKTMLRFILSHHNFSRISPSSKNEIQLIYQKSMWETCKPFILFSVCASIQYFHIWTSFPTCQRSTQQAKELRYCLLMRSTRKK